MPKNTGTSVIGNDKEDGLTALTTIEQSNLSELESVIERNLKAFYEVGNALLQIRDNRLYRESYKTFEDYCRGKWGMSKPYATQMIQASKVRENLVAIATVLPETESQTRPLTSLAPDQQREAWQEAVETAPEGKVTARHVQDVVDKITEKKPRVDPYQNIRPKPEIVSVRFKIAFENMLTTIKNERALKWKETSKEDAEKYVQILLDTIIL